VPVRKRPGGVHHAAGPAATSEAASGMSRLSAAGPLSPGAALKPDPAGFADRYAAARPLAFDSAVERRNHNVFRYPAKFHPPIARRLVELFSAPGDTILDPFCGSGTLLVEGAILGRHCVGTDVDPLAVLVARAKTDLSDSEAIAKAAETFLGWIEESREADLQRWGSFEEDIDEESFKDWQEGLADWIPALPKIDHWFRRRAVLQLAQIRRGIGLNHEGDGERFLTLCFASIIRNASNADPVPVSGLEVTSHMVAKEKQGRVVDPWRLMKRAISKTLLATKEFISDRPREVTCGVYEADARLLDEGVTGKVAAVVTSPPYLTAVDYYRRHTLEMYWLGLTARREERLDLMPRYIGRDRIGLKHLPTADSPGVTVADAWLPRFSGIRPDRERAFRHYCDGMARSLGRMADVVAPGGPIVIVAGDVRFCGVQVSMLELMKDLAGERLVIADHLWYPIRNRYMSYSRNNEANIAADHVLVFRERVERGD
jgi:SAM-dependent methyltransferase